MIKKNRRKKIIYVHTHNNITKKMDKTGAIPKADQ